MRGNMKNSRDGEKKSQRDQHKETKQKYRDTDIPTLEEINREMQRRHGETHKYLDLQGKQTHTHTHKETKEEHRDA